MFQKTVLPNGVRVVTAEAPQYPSTTVSLYIAAGARHDEDALGGTAHFLEHMLFKGTEERPSARQISETVEAVGGILNAGTGREYTTYWAKLPSEHSRRALDLLSEMVQRPLVAPDEVERERRVILEEIKGHADQPPRLARELLNQLLWPEDRLGREIAGTEETVKSISRDDLCAYLQRHYTGSNIVVACGGRIEHTDVVRWAEQELHGLPAEGCTTSTPPARSEGRFGLVGRPVQQASLCLGFPALSYHDPRRYALVVLDAVLGGGMSSRLFLEVRERRGLAYSVGSGAQEYADAGAYVISAGVAPETLAQSVRAVWEQLDRLRTEQVSPEDLARVKSYVKGRTVMSLEGSKGLASWGGMQELLRGYIREPDEALALVDDVTPEDVQSLAGDLFDAEAASLAVAGPFEDEREIRDVWREAVHVAG